VKKQKDPVDADLSERTSHQLFGPMRTIGPFPDSCAPLRDSLARLPISEFQEGIITALKRRLRGLTYEARLADGVVHSIRLGSKQISELENRGVLQYLSRLLLGYVRDRDRAARRPDTLAAATESAATVFNELADDFTRQGQPVDAREMRAWAEIAKRAATKYRRLRPRTGAGRPTSLPRPGVVCRELAALRTWLRPRWDRVRASRRDRQGWERDVARALREILPSVDLARLELRQVLWPKARRRSLDTLAVDLLAAAYRTSRRAVLYATKSR
jgi:hypothetical protein